MSMKNLLSYIIVLCFLSWTTMFSGCHKREATESTEKIDTVLIPPIKYRQEGQEPRKWDRFIGYSDMDSIAIANWEFLTTEEKVEAIESGFIFDVDSNFDSRYTMEERLKILLDNSDVEWL